MDNLWILLISVSVLYIANANDNSMTLDGIKYFQPTYPPFKTWIDAQIYCGAQGGQLAEVQNERIERVVIGFLGAEAPAWVAGKRTNMQYMAWIGQMEAVQPTTRGFLPFHPNKNLSNCAHLHLTEQGIYVYDSIHCENQLKFICQDKGCDITSGLCKVYSPNIQALNWDEAKQKCEEQNQQLLVLPDQIITNLPALNNGQIRPTLKQNISQGRYWLGLQFLGWKWETSVAIGDYITFSGGNQIRNNHETNKNCLKIWQNGTWQPADCREPHGFVCQKGMPGKTTLTTSVSTQSSSTVEKNTLTTSVSTQSSSITVTTAVTEQNVMEADVLNEPSTSKHGLIIGVVAAIVIIIIICIVIIFICVKRKRKTSENNNTQENSKDGVYSYANISQRYRPDLIEPYASSKDVQNAQPEGTEPEYSEISEAGGVNNNESSKNTDVRSDPVYLQVLETSDASENAAATEEEADQETGEAGGPVYAVPNKRKKEENNDDYDDNNDDDVVMVENDLYTQRN